MQVRDLPKTTSLVPGGQRLTPRPSDPHGPCPSQQTCGKESASHPSWSLESAAAGMRGSHFKSSPLPPGPRGCLLSILLPWDLGHRLREDWLCSQARGQDEGNQSAENQVAGRRDLRTSG